MMSSDNNMYSCDCCNVTGFLAYVSSMFLDKVAALFSQYDSVSVAYFPYPAIWVRAPNNFNLEVVRFYYKLDH